MENLDYDGSIINKDDSGLVNWAVISYETQDRDGKVEVEWFAEEDSMHTEHYYEVDSDEIQGSEEICVMESVAMMENEEGEVREFVKAVLGSALDIDRSSDYDYTGGRIEGV